MQDLTTKRPLTSPQMSIQHHIDPAQSTICCPSALIRLASCTGEVHRMRLRRGKRMKRSDLRSLQEQALSNPMGLWPSSFDMSGKWCRLQESNPRPDDYKSTALPTELSRPIFVREQGNCTRRITAKAPASRKGYAMSSPLLQELAERHHSFIEEPLRYSQMLL